MQKCWGDDQEEHPEQNDRPNQKLDRNDRETMGINTRDYEVGKIHFNLVHLCSIQFIDNGIFIYWNIWNKKMIFKMADQDYLNM